MASRDFIVATAAFAILASSGVVGSALAEAPIPITLAATTFSGPVSAVHGNIVSLAGGLAAIDAAPAKIFVPGYTDNGSIDWIKPSDYIYGIYSASSLRAGDPLPAMIIGVSKYSELWFGGIVQAVGADSMTVMGRTISVDPNTNFPNARTFEDLSVGDQVYVIVKQVNGALVATEVQHVWGLQGAFPGKVVHGRVKRASATEWVIADLFAKRDITVFVNGLTKITVEQKVGSIVDALVNSETFIATSIAHLEDATGPVTSIDGNTISLAGGALTVDRSLASFQGGLSIGPNDFLFVTYAASNLAPNAPLPAMFINVVKSSAFSLGGHVESRDSNSATVSGKGFIIIDSNTKYAEPLHGLGDLAVGMPVKVTAHPVNGNLVATDVCARCAAGQPDLLSTGFRGVVMSAGESSWVICDVADRQRTIRLNPETKVTGSPKAGDTVDVLVDPDTGIAAVILNAAVPLTWRMPLTVMRGTVKSISDTSLTIGSTGALPAPDYVLAFGRQSNVAGALKTGDVVDVLLNKDGSTMSVTKLAARARPMTLRGTVVWIRPTLDDEGNLTTCDRVRRPDLDCAWSIAAEPRLPDYHVYMTMKTKIVGAPKVGDRVIAVVEPTADGYILRSITKRQ